LADDADQRLAASSQAVRRNVDDSRILTNVNHWPYHAAVKHRRMQPHLTDADAIGFASRGMNV